MFLVQTEMSAISLPTLSLNAFLPIGVMGQRHYGTAPVNPCRQQNRGSHDYLHAHKGSRPMSRPLIQDSSVSVLFPRYKGNLLKKINRSKLLHYSLVYKEM